MDNSPSAYPDDNPKTAIGMTKPSPSKVPASAIVYASLAMMNGAQKYGAYNWREKKVTSSIYVDAAIRHLMAWFDSREELAPDSGVPHLGHALASISILVDALETGNLVDDRPKAGASARLIEEYHAKAKELIAKASQKAEEERSLQLARMTPQERHATLLESAKAFR